MRCLGYVWWLTFMVLVVGTTGGRACKLNQNATRVLCAIAGLLHASKNIADHYEKQQLQQPFENVVLYKSSFDQNMKSMEGLLKNATVEKKYTAEQLGKLSAVAAELQRKSDQEYEEARSAVESFHEHEAEAVMGATTALGGGGEGERDCTDPPASLLGILRCYHDPPTTTREGRRLVCNEDFNQRLDNQTDKIWTTCHETGEGKDYCSGVVEALQEQLEQWRTLTERQIVGTCPAHAEWENATREAADHMIQLGESLEIVVSVRDYSLASLAFSTALRRGVESGENMKKIAQDVREALFPGAFTTVKTNLQTTKDGRTTGILERRVQVADMELATIFQHYLEGSRKTTQSGYWWISVLVCLNAVVVVEISRRRIMNGPAEYNTTTAQQVPSEELSKLCVEVGTHDGGSTSEAHPEQEAVHAHREAILTREEERRNLEREVGFLREQIEQEKVRGDRLYCSVQNLEEEKKQLEREVEFWKAQKEEEKMRAPEMARREDEQRMQTDKQKEQTKAVGPVPPGFPCPHPLCKKTHAFHEEVEKHIRDDHLNGVKPGADFMRFVCPFCLSHCETYKRMMEHMQHDHEDEEDNHPDSAGMKCRYCEERFRSYGDVVKHIEKDHSGEPALDDDMVVQSMQFKCYHCEKTCASYRGLGGHIREVHWYKGPPQPYTDDECKWVQCFHPLCEQEFPSYEEMNDHIRDDHEDKQKPGVDFMMFVCPFCLSHCETYKRMIEHMQHDHEDEEDNHPDSAGMKCRYCEERFRSYGDVVKHIEKDHSGEPALDDDMVVQSMQFKCYHCEKTCASYRGLGEHIGEVHWNKRPPQPYANDEGMWAPCLHPLCEQEFPSYEEVERHIQDDHLNWGKPGVDFMMFVCPFCLSHCETYKRMIEHMQHDHEDEEDNHPDSAGMKCRYCEERFRSYGDVVKHIEKDHSGEPALDDDMVVQSMQFKCYHCEKTCASYRGLGEHIGEVHWNKRPPQPYANDEGMWAPCLHPLCEQEFPSYEEVERHIQDDHLNWGKPGVDFMMFVCPFCLSHCETYKRMIEHMQHDHEDEEDNHPDSAGMKCRYCEERFRSYGDVVKHIEKDHSGEPALDDDMVVQSMQFKCLQCEKTCASYHLLREHMRDHRKPTRAGDSHGKTDQQ